MVYCNHYARWQWCFIFLFLLMVLPVEAEVEGVIEQTHGELAYVRGLNGAAEEGCVLHVDLAGGQQGIDLDVIKVLDDQVVARARSSLSDNLLTNARVVLVDGGGGSVSARRVIRAVNVAEGPRLDGRLDDPVWEKAESVSGFVQRDPGYWVPCSERTVVRIIYDDQAIYFGFDCQSSDMSSLVANNMRRDSEVWGDDNVQILLDTYNDRQNGFFFFVNPLGARRDLMLSDEGRTYNEDWDCNWQARTQKSDTGWTAEVAIPFDQLRFRASEDMVWGINLARYIPAKNEEAQLVVGRRSSSSRARYWTADIAELHGLKNVQTKRLFQVKPYALPGTGHDFVTPGAAEDPVFESGVDVRYGVTSNLTLDLSYNTDFAQVEGDQEQVNLTQFQLFFPEKREFFLEGANLFDFGEAAETRGGDDKPPTLLFYSRRIGTESQRQVPIVLGAKLAGKVGRTTVGALNVLTDERTYVAGGQNALIPQGNFSVVRVKQDLFSRSNVGGIFVNKRISSPGGADYNRAAGVDMSFSPSPSLNVQGFVARTWDSNIGDTDDARFARAVYQGSTISGQVTFLDVEENFEPAVGFVNRRKGLPGFRRYASRFRVRPRPSIPGIRYFSVGPEFELYTDRNDQVKYWNLEASWWTQFDSADWYRFEARREHNVVSSAFRPSKRRPDLVIPAGTYTFTTFGTGPSSSRARKDRLSVSLEGGGYYTGRRYELSIRNAYRPAGNLSVETEYEVNWLRLPPGNTTVQTLSNRVIYSFTTDFYVKGFVQWNNDSQSMSGNLLVNYRYRPGSDIYVVFDHGFNGDGGWHRQNRTLLVKLSYLLSL